MFAQNIHLHQLCESDLETFLSQELGIKSNERSYPIAAQISPQYFLLPSQGDRPIPFLALARYLEQDIAETFDLRY